jgi:DNA-binding response OmpR family regulator
MSESRVLVVVEDAHIARALTYVLEREGLQVRAARDIDAALATTLDFKPDVVLLDAGIPGQEGHRALRRIREEERLAGAAVILLTEMARADDVVAGLDLGAVDSITKPFDPREVLARVRAQIRIHDLQAQLVSAERWRVLLETAGAVAHEMSQPMTAVMGNLELLMQRLPEDSPHLATLRRIYENGERCVDLLRKLQRIETYKIKAYPGTTGILDIDRSSGD